jgi:hypothetical protein
MFLKSNVRFATFTYKISDIFYFDALFAHFFHPIKNANENELLTYIAQ